MPVEEVDPPPGSVRFRYRKKRAGLDYSGFIWGMHPIGTSSELRDFISTIRGLSKAIISLGEFRG